MQRKLNGSASAFANALRRDKGGAKETFWQGELRDLGMDGPAGRPRSAQRADPTSEL